MSICSTSTKWLVGFAEQCELWFVGPLFVSSSFPSVVPRDASMLGRRPRLPLIVLKLPSILLQLNLAVCSDPLHSSRFG